MRLYIPNAVLREPQACSTGINTLVLLGQPLKQPHPTEGHSWTEAPGIMQSRLDEHHGDAVDAGTSMPTMPKFLAECLASALRGNRQMVTGFTGNSNLTYSVAVSPIYKTP